MRTLLLGVSFLGACMPHHTRQEPARKAVFIILDGIPADVIEKVHTPAIDAIAAARVHARVRRR